jgi:DegV family protein with EDD domain
MRLVTSPGSNLSAAMVERYDVYLPAQHIHVDGKNHDTRAGISFETIDRWVKTAKQHPHVLGTSAAEFIEIFRLAGKDDRELVATMTSRKIIGSYNGAIAASKVMKDLRIAVVDTGLTDLGAGLPTVFAGECIRSGMSFEDVVRATERFASGGAFAMIPRTLEYLVKGGRASSLRAFVANLLDVVPLIAFGDGELSAVSRIARAKKSLPIELATYLASRVGLGRRAWIGVMHGGTPGPAAELADELHRRLDVVFAEVRELQSSIYLHAGPGALAACVFPVDDLGFTAPTPAPF